MKKSYTMLEKVMIPIAFIGLVLAVLGFFYDNLTQIAMIIIAINFIVLRLRDFKNRNPFFSILIIFLLILLILSSIYKLLNEGGFL